LDGFHVLLTDWHPIWLTLRVASVATLLALVAGMVLGWVFGRVHFAGRAMLEALFMLPLVLPPTVLGYYILIVMGRRSPLGRFLRDTFDYTVIFSWHGAVIASSIVALPLVLKSSAAAFAGVDRTMEAAARTLGQGSVSVFLRVTMPLAWRGILAGAMLAFARALGEFGATLMVAGNIPGQTQTLSMAVYDAAQAGHARLALVLVMITSLICVVILVASSKLFSPKPTS
jgi:molybdate transport system permease protein